MIYIGNLKKAFKNQLAVDIDNLKITKGQLVGLVGNNGAGKTTFFRLLLDLLVPDEGVIELDKEPVRNNENWKAFTGAYLDERFLINYLTPKEFWEFVLKTKGLMADELDEILKPYEALLTEDLRSKKYIRELSAGNKARVGIISALITNPELIILDEPFANMDPSSQNALVKILANKSKDTTVLVSSHDLNHIKNISDEIILMEKGKIIKQARKSSGEVEELMRYFD